MLEPLQGPKGQLERTFPDMCDIIQVTTSLRCAALQSSSLQLLLKCPLSNVHAGLAGRQQLEGHQARVQ